jgi:hypothetical protein
LCDASHCAKNSAKILRTYSINLIKLLDYQVTCSTFAVLPEVESTVREKEKVEPVEMMAEMRHYQQNTLVLEEKEGG